MSAVLSATCTCGRRVVVDCPTMGDADWAAAHAAVEAAGFVWHERLGYRCSEFPGCLSDPAPDAEPPEPPEQSSLFGGLAA